MPGRNGSLLPYGSITSTDFRSVTGWTNSGDDNYDYGAIRTPTELGNTVGWLGIAAWPDNELVGLIGNLSGYPGDKPDGTQWYHSRRIASVTSRRIYYDIDTFSGQSGSAVYRLLDGRRHAFAIHTLGTSPGQPMNSGTRIVTPVYNNLVAWIA